MPIAKRPTKKPYKSPKLRSYGDLRTLTQGGTKTRNEANVAGPKTKPTGTG